MRALQALCTLRNRSQNERPQTSGAVGFFGRWRRDRRGTTAIEFAIVAMPFFMFAFGIMGLGLHFFTSNALEHGVEAAARKIRTGQAQKEGKTLADFKQMVCDETGSYINCDSKLRIHVQSGASWAAINPRTCLSNGSLAATVGADTDPLSGSSGGASQAVLVTACYEWDLAQNMPFLLMGDLSNGSALVQAASTFRTEPYQ